MGNYESADHALAHRGTDANGDIAEPSAGSGADLRRDASFTGDTGDTDPRR